VAAANPFAWIAPKTADNILEAVLAYFLIGIYGLLFWRWR
jgi:hypothetical protein